MTNKEFIRCYYCGNVLNIGKIDCLPIGWEEIFLWELCSNNPTAPYPMRVSVCSVGCKQKMLLKDRLVRNCYKF